MHLNRLAELWLSPHYPPFRSRTDRLATDCIRLSTHAQSMGCDGVLIMPASYWPLRQDGVYEHFAAVSAEIEIPICLYNNPWFTGFDMKPHFVRELSKLQNVGAIKESNSDLMRISSIRSLLVGGNLFRYGQDPAVSGQSSSAHLASWRFSCERSALQFCGGKRIDVAELR